MTKSYIYSLIALLITLQTFPMEEQPIRALALDQEILDQGLIQAVKNNVLEDVRHLLQLGANANAREAIVNRVYTAPLHFPENFNTPIDYRFHEHVRSLIEPHRSRNINTSLLIQPIHRLHNYHENNSSQSHSGFFNRPPIPPRSHDPYVQLSAMINHMPENPAPRTITTLGFSALELACSSGNVEMCELLLQHGADANRQQERSHYSLLHIATEQNNAAMIQLLIHYGADIHAKNLDGASPLHLAAQHRNHEACHALINGGANPYSEDDTRHTPLHRAALAGHRDTCKVLLNKNYITFLACIRRQAQEGSLGAQTLYRERNNILRPLLAYQAFEEILEDTPERKAEIRAQEYAAQIERVRREREEQGRNNNNNNDNNAPAAAAAPVALPAPIIAPAIPAALPIPAPAPIIIPAMAEVPAEPAVDPAYEYEQPRLNASHSESILNKPIARGVFAISGIALASVALYKLYEWVRRKPAKNKHKKEVKNRKSVRLAPA